MYYDDANVLNEHKRNMFIIHGPLKTGGAVARLNFTFHIVVQSINITQLKV